MEHETFLCKSERKTVSKAAALICQLAEKLKQGAIILGQNNNRITQEMPENITLEIKVEEEEDT